MVADTSIFNQWYTANKSTYNACSCVSDGSCANGRFSGGFCNTSITPDFNVQTTITSGQSATFTNTSSSVAATWLWSVMNSSGGTVTTSSSKDFSYAFSSVGTYSVSLKSTPTDTRCPVSTKTQTITVNQQCVSPVTANFSASSTSITQGGSVLFSNASSGSISTYTWSFGDGS